MDFDLNEEQNLLKRTVERFVQDRYANGERYDYVRTETGYCAKGWSLMAETGITALPFDEDHGGLGGSIEEIAMISRVLGQGLAVEPVLSNLLLGGWTLQEAGSADQRAHWLPRIAAGESHVSLAHMERGARFNLNRVKTVFKGGGSATLTGEKTAVLGGTADQYIVTAVPAEGSGEPSSDSLALFLVDAAAEGLERKTYRLMDGSVACDLKLTNAKAERLDGGAEALAAVIAKARVVICAEMIGIMSFLFEQTLDYLKTRQQFGQPIGRFQVIQHRMADQYAKLELSESQLFIAVDAAQQNPVGHQLISGAKAFIAENAQALAEECVQLHGGMGVTDELLIGHGLKRILVLATLFGDTTQELRQYCA